MYEWLRALDRDVLLGINSMHYPWLDPVMWVISMTMPTVLIVLAVCIPFHRRYDMRKTATFLVGCALVFATTDSTTNLVKHNVKRYRPTHNLEIGPRIHKVEDYSGGQYGFYSAHASNTFGVITFLLLCTPWLPRVIRVLIGIWPFLVVYSRMYLGVHYPSDIFVGTVTGISLAILIYLLMNKYFFRFNEAT